MPLDRPPSHLALVAAFLCLGGTAAVRAEEYGWLIDAKTNKHWQLVNEEKGAKHLRLHVGVFDLAEDLREGVFGPSGYFEILRTDATLQQGYLDLLAEFDQYTV